MSISSQTRVTPTKHLGVHTWNFFLLSPLEAGSLWVQIPLFEKKMDPQIKNSPWKWDNTLDYLRAWFSGIFYDISAT